MRVRRQVKAKSFSENHKFGWLQGLGTTPSPRNRFLIFQRLHDFSPSGQACAHGLFERGTGRVGVEQDIGIARFNFDIAALLGNHVA
jgi:hypothetical protein